MARDAMRLAGVTIAAVLSAIGPAGDAVAKKPSLRDVAKEAAKPSDEQQVLGRERPSETKYKKEAPAPEPREAEYVPDSGGWIDLGLEVWHVLADGSDAPSGPRIEEYMDVDPPPPPTYLRVGATVGGGGLAFDTFGPIGSGGVLFGVGKGRLGFDLRGQYTRGRFPPELRAGFETLDGWAGDAVLRWRVSEPISEVDVSLMLTGRLGFHEWGFRNAVQVATPAGVRTVDRDSIRYGTLLVGIGVVPFRGRQWALEFTAAGGRQEFDGTTKQGFENDVFADGVVVEGRVEVVFSPRW
jgi:hypothetical protein